MISNLFLGHHHAKRPCQSFIPSRSLLLCYATYGYSLLHLFSVKLKISGDFPLLNLAGLVGETNTYLEELARVGGKGLGIALVLDLF